MKLSDATARRLLAEAATEALGHMGSAAATRRVVAGLLALAKRTDGESELQLQAVRALGQMRSAIVSKDVIRDLLSAVEQASDDAAGRFDIRMEIANILIKVGWRVFRRSDGSLFARMVGALTVPSGTERD